MKSTVSDPSGARATAARRSSAFGRGERAFVFVALLAGCAWAQAPASEAKSRAEAERVYMGSIHVTALDAERRPLSGATIVASPVGAELELFPVVARTEAEFDGSASLALPDGLYSLSVLVRGVQAEPVATWVAGRRPAGSWTGPPVELLSAPVDLPFAGAVLLPDGKPAAAAFVHVERREDGVVLHAETDGEGKFGMTLPRGTWRAFAESKGLRAEWQDRGPSNHRFALAVLANDVLAPVPAPVVAELASALGSRKPDGALDVAALAKELGSARVVGVGDALRGAHEELQFGAELFRALVEGHGFQLLALDAPFGEVWSLNGWVLDGKGDVEELLRGVTWGEWQRVEVLELLRWMRAWNADEKHVKKVQVVGLDVMHTRAAALFMTEFYPRADVIGGQRFSGWMTSFRTVNEKGLPPYERFDEEDRTSLRLMMSDLVGVFPDEHDNYLVHVSEEEFQVAHQHVRTLGACEEVLRLAGQGWTTRDRERFMPERLKWMLARCGEGAKAMVWGRNGVVGVQGEAEFGSLGWWLRSEYGGGFAGVAVCVGEGKVVLPDGTVETKGNPPPAEFGLAAPVGGSVEDALRRVGGGVGVLQVAKLPEKGVARAWLGGERLRKGIDDAWRGELGLYRRGVPAAEFDWVVWLPRVTAAKPLPAK